MVYCGRAIVGGRVRSVVALVLVFGLFAPGAAAQHQPPNSVPGNVQFNLSLAGSDQTGATFNASYSTTAYHDAQCAMVTCYGNQYRPYYVALYLDRPDGTGIPAESVVGPSCQVGVGSPTFTCDPKKRDISDPAATLPGAATISFKVTQAVPPGSKAEVVVEGYSINTYATADVPQLPERYKLELKAWIPQPELVDPVHPFPLPLNGSTPDSCLRVTNRPGWQESDFAGDDHTGFDGGARADASLQFEWDGSRMSAPDPSRAPAFSHRHWLWRFDPVALGHQKRCSQGRRVTDHGIAVLNGDNKAVVTANAGDALFDLPGTGSNLAPPLQAELTGSFTSPTSLRLSVYATYFPSFAVRVYKNDQLIYENVLQDGSCVPGGPSNGVGAAAVLTALLATGANHGPFVVATDLGHPVRLSAPCKFGSLNALASAISAPAGTNTATANSAGRVAVPAGVFCGTGPCTVTVNAGAAGMAAAARALSVRFRLKTHQSKAIVLRLSAASRRALLRKHRLAARVAIRIVDGAGKSRHKTVKLKVVTGHR
jgi:hypothetical protein